MLRTTQLRACVMFAFLGNAQSRPIGLSCARLPGDLSGSGARPLNVPVCHTFVRLQKSEENEGPKNEKLHFFGCASATTAGRSLISGDALSRLVVADRGRPSKLDRKGTSGSSQLDAVEKKPDLLCM